MKVNYLMLTILAGSAFILLSCISGNKAAAVESSTEEVLPEDMVELREDQVKLAGIELGRISMQKIGNTLRTNGIVSAAPQNIAFVSVPMGGFVKNTTLIPGNPVSKGQTIAVIENQDFVDIQQNYLEARNKLSFAKAEFERHSSLFKEDVYSEQNLQQVTVEYKNLEGMVKALEQKLLMIGIDPSALREENISSAVSLKAPIDGYLKSVNVNIGKYVSPTDVLFEIVNNDKLFLELTLFEKDVEKAVKGQKIKFFVNNGNDEYEAVITQPGRSVSNDKTFKVFAAITKTNEKVLPGMYVNAVIEETSAEATALPSDAVVSFDDKDYVFIFDKNKVEAGLPFTEYRMIEVRKGASASGYTQVTFSPGFDHTTAKFVVKGAYNLLSAKKNAGEMAC